MSANKPGTVGAIDEETGRVCVLVSEFAASTKNGEAPAYWFVAEAEELGLDPWALIDGVDPRTDAVAFDVWFENGQCKTVDGLATLYVAAVHADAFKNAEQTP